MLSHPSYDMPVTYIGTWAVKLTVHVYCECYWTVFLLNNYIYIKRSVLLKSMDKLSRAQAAWTVLAVSSGPHSTIRKLSYLRDGMHWRSLCHSRSPILVPIESSYV